MADSTSERVIAQVALSDQQLQGLNAVLEQVRPNLTLQPDERPVDGVWCRLIVWQAHGRIEISSALTAGSVSYQLQTVFNVLLDISCQA